MLFCAFFHVTVRMIRVDWQRQTAAASVHNLKVISSSAAFGKMIITMCDALNVSVCFLLNLALFWSPVVFSCIIDVSPSAPPPPIYFS